MLSSDCVETQQGNKLMSNLTGKAHPKSPQLAEPLHVDP